jgi:acyl carrier protein
VLYGTKRMDRSQLEELNESSEFLDRVELAMSIEEEFGIRIADEEFPESGGRDTTDGSQS